MNRLLGGAIAGFVATIPMTCVIALGRGTRMLLNPPPKQITGSAASRAGILHKPSSEKFKFGWVAAHFGYGAACGAIYGATKPIFPADTRIAGLLFGEAVWAVSYLGYVPALGLYPWPKDDSKSRMAVMIAAHAVYGMATTQIDRALSISRDPPDVSFNPQRST